MAGDEHGDPRPTGTVTFLFTDVEGSTRSWAADKEAMSASLSVHDARLRSAIESNGGYVFTTAGDSFAAAFPRPTDALRAATDAQRALADAEWPGPELKVRMGLHLGEAEERGGDYFGPVVNTAARVEAAGHGRQVLITEAVRLAAGITDVTDLGSHRLRDVAEPVRLFQLGEGAFPPLRVVDPGLSNLPARPTRLIGRDDEVLRVRQLLGEHRLVTITAVGGVGKTRLAIAIGESELAHRVGGVWFADLTTVVNGSDVPTAIANAVGLSLGPGDAIDQVIRYLADKPALVILDNCEHVIDDCAEFSERFLALHGPAVVLATSREALDVEGERCVVLGSLPSDAPDSPAVRLFVDRAGALDPSFEVADDAATISAICGRLDGMPLAIELAAARITVMTAPELLVGLDDRFQLLAGGRRRQRQRTLEAMLDWSYDLLEPAEQEVFRALGVFVDGFDLDAAAAAASLDRARAMTVVEALVAKSLVVRAEGGDTARFGLLETVKAYAEDRLVDAGEAAAVRNRHLEHFRGLAMAHGRSPLGYLSVGIRLRHDTSNVVGAFEWASGSEQWTAGGELLAGSTMAFFVAVQMSEYRALADRALLGLASTDPELAGYVRSQNLFALGMHQDWPAFLPMARELTTAPTAVLRSTGWAMLAWLAAFTDAEVSRKFLARAQAEYDDLDALAMEREAGVPFATMRWAAATVALHDGDYRAASEYSQPVVDTTDRAAWTYLTLEHSSIVAVCQVLLGTPARALDTVAERDHYALDFFDGAEITSLAHLALDELDRARQTIRTHATRAATGRVISESDDSLVLLAALAHCEGDDEVARELLSSTGLERQPSTIAYAGDLAKRLGMSEDLDEQRRRVRVFLDEQALLDVSQRSLAALRSELHRRGWS